MLKAGEPIHYRHHQVKKDQVNLLGLQQIEKLLPTSTGNRLHSFIGEFIRNQTA
tara:strand:- start:145 stop:306 length:162 start_codon:yes stop_codon:yes gene_type:complete